MRARVVLAALILPALTAVPASAKTPKPSCKTTTTTATVSTTTSATAITTVRLTTQVRRCKLRVKMHHKWRTRIKTTTTRTYATTTQPVAQPAPTPTPAPPTKSEPAPAKPIESLSITMVLWEPINTANPEWEKPQPAQHLAAIELSLTNVGATAISGNANFDTTAIGTNGQSYTSNFDERKGCTDFASGQFTLAPGAHEVGCIVYELPEGVKIAKVQFGLNGEVETTRTV